MKFKTKRTSETGKKFVELELLLAAANKARQDLLSGYSICKIAVGTSCSIGGLSWVYFEENSNICNKTWRRIEGGAYVPNRRYKEGKRLGKAWDNLPTIGRFKFNDCVGFISKGFEIIGFDLSNTEYILFSVGDDWDFSPPHDCQEITVSEYRKLGSINED